MTIPNGKRPCPEMIFRLHLRKYRFQSVPAVHIQQMTDLDFNLPGSKVTVPLFPGCGQDVFDCRHQPRLAVPCQADAEGDPVGGEKTDAIEIIGQAVRIRKDHLYRPVTVFFVDPY
jgi:hypothetical protein